MKEPTFSRGRKWRVGFSVTVALLSAFALVVMINYLAARHPFRYNWSNAAGNKLTPMTVRVLNSLTNNVKVIVFFKRGEPLFSSVSSMIKDYQAVSPKLDVEFVDYRYPGRGNLVMAQYKLVGANEGSQVIFDCNGRWKSIGVNEMSDYAVTPEREIRRTAFKGEQLFTSAIVSVTSQRRLKAYFLTGHGEHSPESEDDQEGYSRFAKMLTASDVELAIMDSLHNRDVPEDCSLLVIAGPTTRFSSDELERLTRYLTQGGRLFVFFRFVTDPKRQITGLEDFLAAWNVGVGANVVIDHKATQASQTGVVIASKYGPHAITRPLLRTQIALVAPRTISARANGANRADAPKVSELIFSSENAVALGNIEKGKGEPEKSGSLPLAAAVEKGGIQGVAADRGATRIVVVGSSVSFANVVFESSNNADFAMLASNWLLNRDIPLSDIPPRAISDFRLTITERQMRALRWMFLAAAPGAAMGVGTIVWLKRRK